MWHLSRCAVCIAVLATAVSYTSAAEAPPTLEQAKGRVSAAQRTPVGDLTLAGCDTYEEVRLSTEVVLLAFPCRAGGGLAAFDSTGKLRSTIATGEFTSIALWDVDEDGTLEVLLDEVTQWGTGLLAREYRLYRVSAGRLSEVWRAVSTSRHSSWTPDAGAGPETEEQSGFTRFEPGGGGHPPRWVYTLRRNERGPSEVLEESTYEWRGGRATRVKTRERLVNTKPTGTPR